MDYSLSLTRDAAKVLRGHLLGDRSREQMAVTLCGVNRLYRELRLLVRDVILLPPDAFRQQSSARLELKPEVQAFIHRRAHGHGLIQVDWHSHPGDGPYLAFSPTDDRHEAAQAAYLAHRMDGVPYGSVVLNDSSLDARLWLTRASRCGGGGAISLRGAVAWLFETPSPTSHPAFRSSTSPVRTSRYLSVRPPAALGTSPCGILSHSSRIHGSR